jgi:hypothetical protein
LRKLSSHRRGILGQQAPAFDLKNWIGSDGSKLKKPIELEALKLEFVVHSEFHLKVPMAHDDGSQVDKEGSVLMDRYQTGGTPWIVIVDPSGRIVFNNFHISSDRAIEYIRSNLPE